MIVRDAEDTLLTTLRSIEPVVDEIRIHDTGSLDGTLALLRYFAASSRVAVRVEERPWPDDFSAARNRSVDGATGDWILWIDADERLIGGERLRRLLQSEHWEAYAIRQHNQIFDRGVTQIEVPFRVYRNGRGYRFYGAIHEHPERALNEHIEPWTLAEGVEILHYGYLTEPGRRKKLRGRNLALLERDFQLYPGRRLTEILYLRDCVNFGSFDRQESGRIREDHLLALREAVARFEDTAMRSRDHFYHLGRRYYDQALDLLGEGAPVALQVAGERIEHRVRHPADAAWLAGAAAARAMKGEK